MLSPLNDAYSLVNAGLPSLVWLAIFLFVFLISIAAIVYRQHHVIQRTTRPHTVEQPTKTGTVVPSFRSQFPKGIDTQWGWPDLSTLETENRISIPLRVFNGTTFKVRVNLKPEGLMLFEGHLAQHATLTVTDAIDWLLPGLSATFILVQPLSPKDAEQFKTLLDDGKTGHLLYNTFKILITAMDPGGDNNSTLTGYLPFNENGLTINIGIRVGQIQMRAGTT